MTLPPEQGTLFPRFTLLRTFPTFCLGLLWLAASQSSAEYAELRQDGLLILYPPRQEGRARDSFQLLSKARDQVSRELGLPADTPASVELLPTQQAFEARVGRSSHTGLLGVAYSPAGRIVINLSKLGPGRTDNLSDTLAHEMVHIMLGRFEEDHGVNLPRWFHEGVACWLGRVLPQHPNDRRLRIAAAQGALIPFNALDKHFPELRVDTQLAYLQSEDFIRFLVRRHGPDAIARMLRSYADHRNMRTAVPAALGVDLLDEEAVWRERLKVPYPILWIFWQNFTWLTAGAALTVISFLFYRRRRARLLRQWDAEQAARFDTGDSAC